MSSITKILTEKDKADADKLKAVAETVAVARENYGNKDAEIAVPMIDTVHGKMGFDVLEDEAKVAVLRGEVGRIKAQAVEFTTQNEGTNINKKIEELIATNGFFVNVAPGTTFDYI